MDKEKKYKLSVVVLTFNNEKTIKQCLDSARWAHQLVVVDSLSTDKTFDIARQYTSDIYQRQWPGFANQWNFGIDKADGSWILILASDEVISEELKTEIQDVLNTQVGLNGYYLPRKTYFLGKWIKHCGWYPDNSIRLMKKGFGRYDESKLVHETIIIEGKTGCLREHILHYSYFSIFNYIERMNKYTSLAAQQMLKDGVQLSENEIRKKALSRTLKTFWKMYVKQAGFKDGAEGLFLSFFSAIYQFFVYVKYREIWKGELWVN